MVGGVGGDELALQVAGQFGDFQAMLTDPAFQLIGVGFGGGAFFQVDQAAVPSRDLYAFVAEAGHIFTDSIEGVEGGFVSHELGEEDGWAFYVGHGLRS